MAAIRNSLEFVIKIEMKTILISPVHLISLRANGAIRSPLKDVIDPPIPKTRFQISSSYIGNARYSNFDFQKNQLLLPIIADEACNSSCK